MEMNKIGPEGGASEIFLCRSATGCNLYWRILYQWQVTVVTDKLCPYVWMQGNLTHAKLALKSLDTENISG